MFEHLPTACKIHIISQLKYNDFTMIKYLNKEFYNLWRTEDIAKFETTNYFRTYIHLKTTSMTWCEFRSILLKFVNFIEYMPYCNDPIIYVIECVIKKKHYGIFLKFLYQYFYSDFNMHYLNYIASLVSKHKDLDVIEWLLELGADVELQITSNIDEIILYNKYNKLNMNQSLILCCMEGNRDSILFLNMLDVKLDTPHIKTLIRHKHFELFKDLLFNDLDAFHSDLALIIASKQGNMKSVYKYFGFEVPKNNRI